MTTQKMKLVLVEWVDSHSINPWESLENLKRNCRPMRCKSVGWLTAQKDGHTLIVPHIAEADKDNGPDGSGSITIPDGAIIKISELSE